MKKNDRKDFLLRYATLALAAGVGGTAAAQETSPPAPANPQGVQISGNTGVNAVYGPPPNVPQGVQIQGNTSLRISDNGNTAVYGPAGRGNVAKNAIGAIKGGTVIKGKASPRAAD